MLSTRPYLRTFRPSPTSVLYTVSTYSRRSLFPFGLLQYALLVARLLASIVTLLYINLSISSDHWVPVRFTPYCHPLISTTNGLALTLLLLLMRRPHTEESLLLLRSLGVQISSTSPWYLWPSSTRFIPTSEVQDIFIHEAFRGFEVRYYLGVIIGGSATNTVTNGLGAGEDTSATHAQNGEEDGGSGGGIVVVFPKILPGRAIVEEVWRGARECLYEPAAAKE